jgi:hypothetical protein
MIPNAKMPENAPEREAAEKNIAILKTMSNVIFNSKVYYRVWSLCRG